MRKLILVSNEDRDRGLEAALGRLRARVIRRPGRWRRRMGHPMALPTAVGKRLPEAA